ncbi:MAG: hypothetical protein R6X13_04745, partial [bacterium]
MKPASASSRGVARWATREFSGTAMAAALLVAASGRWDWVAGWALVGVYALTFAAQAALLIPRSPELLAERSARMRGDTRSWDKALLPFYGLATLALLVFAGLEARFGRAASFPPGLR